MERSFAADSASIPGERFPAGEPSPGLGAGPVSGAVERMPPVYFVCWSLFRLLFGAYFRWRRFNVERVPAHGPVILASNHASFMDPPLIGACLSRPLNYLARDSLFGFPVLGAALRHVKAVPVDRDGANPAGLKAILGRLAAGEAVLLFPEGTRTADGLVQRARPGIGLAVRRSGAPVVPVRVFGTFEAFSRHHRVPRPVRVAVKFGRPLDFSQLCKEAEHAPRRPLRRIHEQMADEILDAIERLEAYADVEEFP